MGLLSKLIGLAVESVAARPTGGQPDVRMAAGQDGALNLAAAGVELHVEARTRTLHMWSTDHGRLSWPVDGLPGEPTRLLAATGQPTPIVIAHHRFTGTLEIVVAPVAPPPREPVIPPAPDPSVWGRAAEAFQRYAEADAAIRPPRPAPPPARRRPPARDDDDLFQDSPDPCGMCGMLRSGPAGSVSCSTCGGSGGRDQADTHVNVDGSLRYDTVRMDCVSCGGSGRERCPLPHYR